MFRRRPRDPWQDYFRAILILWIVTQLIRPPRAPRPRVQPKRYPR